MPDADQPLPSDIEWLIANGIERQFQLHDGNRVYLSIERQKIDLPPQDLM